MTATTATPTTARKRRQTAQQDAVDCRQPREIVAPRPFHPVHRLYDLQSENPLRPPDWRYQAALQLVDRGELSDGDDALRTPILRVLHQLRPSGFDEHPSEAQLELYDRALQIYLGPAEPQKAVLEAHLLAGRLAAEAGLALRLSPGVAEAYEYGFFDVRDRLGRQYIDSHVLGVVRPPEPRLGYVVRAFAHAGGPLVLDDLLHGVGIGEFALTPACAFLDPLLVDLTRRATIALLLLPGARNGLQIFLEIRVREQKLEAKLARLSAERGRKARIRYQRWILGRARRAFGRGVSRNPFLTTLFTYIKGP
jgi:hypothetical protein